MVLQQRKASQKHPVKALEVKETAISGSCWNWQGPQASLPKAAETIMITGERSIYKGLS